jgi:hypothetical protein
MSPSRAEFSHGSRRAIRWLVPTALLALMPKCVVCVLAYVGIGAALGLGGPEWCRAGGNARFAWMTVLAWAGVAGIAGVLATWRRKISRSEDSGSN